MWGQPPSAVRGLSGWHSHSGTGYSHLSLKSSTLQLCGSTIKKRGASLRGQPGRLSPHQHELGEESLTPPPVAKFFGQKIFEITPQSSESEQFPLVRDEPGPYPFEGYPLPLPPSKGATGAGFTKMACKILSRNGLGVKILTTKDLRRFSETARVPPPP
jgi:hypothetical protein